MQIAFDVSWKKQLSRNLRIAVDNLQNMKEFHEDAIDIMEKRSLDIFKGKWKTVEKWDKWARLAPSTEKARARGWWYYSKPASSPSTLVWTGKMMNSRKKTATNSYGVFEFTDKKAQYHQKGWWNLPQRPLIDLDNKTNAEIVRALQSKVNRDLKVFWLQR